MAASRNIREVGEGLRYYSGRHFVPREDPGQVFNPRRCGMPKTYCDGNFIRGVTHGLLGKIGQGLTLFLLHRRNRALFLGKKKRFFSVKALLYSFLTEGIGPC